MKNQFEYLKREPEGWIVTGNECGCCSKDERLTTAKTKDLKGLILKLAADIDIIQNELLARRAAEPPPVDEL